MSSTAGRAGKRPADDARPAQPARAPEPDAGSAMTWKGGGTKFSSVVLGFFAWVWVVLPFIRGGRPEVAAVLRAKFLNQTSQGVQR